MQFLPSPDPDRLPRRPEKKRWLWMLFVSAAVIVLATRWPWIEVAFQRIFGSETGPPGWKSGAGFTCACTGALVTVLALAETPSQASKQAARPGSLLLVTVAALMLALELVKGPGTLRGVSAAWTPWFWTTCAAVPFLLLAAHARWRAAASGRQSTGI